MLEPKRLLTFREVALHRSFSEAAEALSLTQPAVSQQIRALETQLGTRLIDRRRGLFALTPPGELLLDHAEALAERLRLAETQLAETLASERMRLRLGAFPSVLAGLVPTAVARLREATGELELSLVEGSTAALVERISDGRMHVAICFEDAAEEPRVHEATRRYELFREPMVAIVAPTHRLAGRKRVRLNELAREHWIAATPDGLIYRACVAAGFEPRVSYMTGDPLAIRALVAAGLAVSLTPRLLAPYLPGVVALPVAGDAPPQRTVYGLTPEPAVHDLALPFLDAVRAAAGEAGIVSRREDQRPAEPQAAARASPRRSRERRRSR